MVYSITYISTFRDPYFRDSSYNSTAERRRHALNGMLLCQTKFSTVPAYQYVFKRADKNLPSIVEVFDINDFLHLTLHNLIIMGYYKSSYNFSGIASSFCFIIFIF